MAGVVIVIIMVMNGSANAGNAKMANFSKKAAFQDLYLMLRILISQMSKVLLKKKKNLKKL